MKKKEYLLVIRVNKKNEIFSFDSKKNRTLAIKDMKKINKNLEYLTSEIES